MNKNVIIFFISILLSVSFNSYAQTKHSRVFDIYAADDTSYTKTSALSKSQTIFAKPTLNYYWYSYGKIAKTQGGYSGKLLQGTCTIYYLDNNLNAKGEFKKGLKNGRWSSWYKGGTIKENSHWKKGQKSGSYLLYDKNGKIIYRASFRKDMLNGKVTSYNKNGEATTKIYHNSIVVQPKIKTGKKNLLQKIKEIFSKKNKKADN